MHREVRAAVLRGGFCDEHDACEWVSPRWKISVFLSSSRDDISDAERTMLHDDIVPDINIRGRRHDVSLSVVDTWWGASKNATRDWCNSRREIEFCMKTSADLSFVTFLSDTYGTCTLPRRVAQHAQDRLLSRLNDAGHVLWRQWYTVDANATPPEYVLRNDVSGPEWERSFPLLQFAMQGVTVSPGITIGRGILEWEAKLAISNAALHTRWICRSLSAEKENGKSEGRCEEALTKLRHWIRNELRFHHILELPRSLKKWRDGMADVLMRSLNATVRLRYQWHHNGLGLGVPGLVAEEMLYHCEIACEHCTIFQGRHSLLQNALAVIFAPPGCSGPMTNTASICSLNVGNGGVSITDPASTVDVRRSSSVQPHIQSRPRRSSTLPSEVSVTPLLHRSSRSLASTEQSLMSVAPPGRDPSLYRAQTLSPRLSILSPVRRLSSLANAPPRRQVSERSSSIVEPPSIRRKKTDEFSMHASQLSAQDSVTLTPARRMSTMHTCDEQSLSQSSLQNHSISVPKEPPSSQPSSFSPRRKRDRNDLKRTHFRPFSRITLAVIGESGTGKSALMAKLADTVYKSQHLYSRPVIIRHCGDTPGSLSGIELVRGICHQIHLTMGLAFDADMSKLSYVETVRYFHKLLADFPVVLFIDALDRLDDTNLARSDLSFLKHVIPHHDTRIVVSTLPDKRDLSNGEWIEFYGCATKLKRSGVPIIRVPSLNKDEGGEMVDYDRSIKSLLLGILNSSNRTVTPNQLYYVMEQVSYEPTMLYLSLATTVVGKWSSEDKPECDGCVLSPGVSGLINQIMENIEKMEGIYLTSVTLGLISYSVRGIRESEFEDLLSLYPDVMNVIRSYNSAPRIPTHVWHPVLFAASSLLIDVGEGQWVWRHQKVKEVARRRYAHMQHMLHSTLAKYFGNLISSLPSGVERAQRIAPQPLVLNGESSMCVWFDDAQINSRRCVEAGHHMIAAGMYSEAVVELCTIEGTCARAKCKNISVLISELEDLYRALPQSQLVEHYIRWLRRDGSTLLLNPSFHTIRTSYNQPNISLVKADVVFCLSQYVANTRISDISATHWLRCKLLGGPEDFESCMNVIDEHTDTVVSVCCNSDENFVVSGTSTGAIGVWDISSGSAKLDISGQSAPVTSVDISPDGRAIASACQNGIISLWDVTTGELMHSISGHTNSVACVAFSPDSSKLVSAALDATVRIWNSFTGSEVYVLKGHKSEVLTARFSPSGKFIASGSTDMSVRLWDCSTGVLTNILDGIESHSKRVTCLSFSSGGDCLATGSCDDTVKLWKLTSDTDLSYVLHILEHGGPVTAVCYNPSDDSQIVSSAASIIYVWDATVGRVLSQLSLHRDCVQSVSFSRHGHYIVSGSSDCTIRLWETCFALRENQVTDGNCISTNTLQLTSYVGHQYRIMDVCYSTDGSTAVSVSVDETVCLWRVSDGSLIAQYTVSGLQRASCVCINAVTLEIVLGHRNSSLCVWNILKGGKSFDLVGHSDRITALCTNMSGTYLLSGSMDRTVCLWDFKNGVLLSLVRTDLAVSSLCFSEDGSKVAAGCFKCLIVWNIEDKEFVNIQSTESHIDTVTSVLFSPDGETLLSGSKDCTVKIWRTRKQMGTTVCSQLVHDGSVTCMCISSDGRTVISAASDNYITVWDIHTGSVVRSFSGNERGFCSLALSPDGQQLMAGTHVGRVCIWDVFSARADDIADETVDDAMKSWEKLLLENRKSICSEQS